MVFCVPQLTPPARCAASALHETAVRRQGRLHPLNLSGALFSLPPLGVVLRAANQDSNDCRWQSYLCFVPRSGKGGVVGNFGLVPFNEQHPLSLALLDSSPTGEPRFPCCPLWGTCRVSGKGGGVGNFGLVPFIGRHPLSLALLDSSPTGEPRPLLPPRGSQSEGYP